MKEVQRKVLVAFGTFTWFSLFKFYGDHFSYYPFLKDNVSFIIIYFFIMKSVMYVVAEL